MQAANRLSPWILALTAVTVPAHAQSGREDSPEDPTIVLVVLGGAGALAASIRAAHKRAQVRDHGDSIIFRCRK